MHDITTKMYDLVCPLVSNNEVRKLVFNDCYTILKFILFDMFSNTRVINIIINWYKQLKYKIILFYF